MITMKSFISLPRIVPLFAFACVGLTASAIDLRPENWIRDIGKLWERTQPSVKDVTFWDFENQQYRGVRTLFYTVPKERENRMVDLRLHRKMQQFLSYICREVITVDDFKDNPYLPLVETNISQLVDEWKLAGRVNPKNFFEKMTFSGGSYPVINVDIVVLMERIFYDQQWRGDTKKLVIGIGAAAFEMDGGEPVYQDRIMVESNWSGETGTSSKAEHAAVLQAADAFGRALQAKANEINAEHARLEKQKLIARVKEETARNEQIKEETRQFKQLVERTENILAREPVPEEIMLTLRDPLDAIKPLLKKIPPKIRFGNKSAEPIPVSKNELTEEDIDTRRQLAASIQNTLSGWDAWKQEEEDRLQKEALASQPSLQQKDFQANVLPSVPTEPPPGASMVGLPNLSNEKGNLFSRRWLLNPNQSLQLSPVPIAPVTGTIRRTEIYSTDLPGQSTDSLRPSQSNGTVSSVTAGNE